MIDDFELSAIKTGMLPTGDIIGEVARLVRENDLKNFVVDPVVRSTSGFDLIDDQALRVLIERLFPLADIVTPNLPEAERISGIKIETPTDIERAARLMQRLGARNVLIKGGHNSIVDFGFGILDCLVDGEGLAKPVSKKARDFLFAGDEKLTFEDEFIETTSTHGTGCTLASAIAANLSLGKPLAAAVETAKRYVTEAIRTAPNIGKGNGPINHFVRM